MAGFLQILGLLLQQFDAVCRSFLVFSSPIGSLAPCFELLCGLQGLPFLVHISILGVFFVFFGFGFGDGPIVISHLFFIYGIALSPFEG